MSDDPTGAISPRSTYVFMEDGGDALSIPVTPAFWSDLISGTPSSEATRRVLESTGWLLVGYQASGGGRWEMHPIGEEILFSVDCHFEVALETDDGERVVPVAPGQVFVVPRGVWHQQRVTEPGMVLAMTYGKGTQHRN